MKSYLLDTHVWIWANQDPAELGRKCKALLLHPEAALNVATISHLEVARLATHERIQLTMPVRDWCHQASASLEASVIAMDDRTAIEAYELPGAFHDDPADRIIVATARVHGLTLVTADKRILAYQHVRSVDARK